MKKGNRKCYICNNFFPIEEITLVDNKAYCPKCVNNHSENVDTIQKDIEDSMSKEDKTPEIFYIDNPKRVTKKTKGSENKIENKKESSLETDYNKAIADFIYNLCNHNQKIMPFLMAQVKHLKVAYDFTPRGIFRTLQYAYQLSESPPVFNPEVGIEWTILKYYSSASKYHDQIIALKKQPSDFIDKTLQIETKEIHLNKDMLKYKNDVFIERMKNKTYGPKIDLNMIDDEEEEFYE